MECDQVCPRCKTTKYRNPQLKLMVNVCGHVLCETCIELLFVKGASKCPECQTQLRRNNFRVQLFEDGMIEKEVDIRRGILKVYNRTEETFSSLREYNDYLEEVENIIFDVVNGNDKEVLEANKKIEQYKKENRDMIKRTKTSQEAIELEEIIEQEKHLEEYRKIEIANEASDIKKKQRAKESLIDNLIQSNSSAESILANHQVKLRELNEKPIAPRKKQMKFSSGIRIGLSNQQNTFLPIVTQEEGEPYYHENVVLSTVGPLFSSLFPLENYLPQVRAESVIDKAGGFNSKFTCVRYLQEAMSGLYFVPAAHQDVEMMDVSS